jgi:hypothetical protein
MTSDPVAEIRRLYFSTTGATILRDFDRAIALLKSLPEQERTRAAVYMEGLAEMRKEFAGNAARPRRKGPARPT